MVTLVTCPHCGLVAKLTEDDCPHCRGALRGRDGAIALTAAAALLGLTMSACVDPRPEPTHGVPPDIQEPPPSPEPTATPTTTATAQPSTADVPTPAPRPTVPPPPAAAYGVPPVSDPIGPPKKP